MTEQQHIPERVTGLDAVDKLKGEWETLTEFEKRLYRKETPRSLRALLFVVRELNAMEEAGLVTGRPLEIPKDSEHVVEFLLKDFEPTHDEVDNVFMGLQTKGYMG